MRPRQDAHPRLDFTDDWATTMIPRQGTAPVLVACPDARPPAYQAVIGLHREGLLRRFLTAFYYQERPRLAAFGRSLAPARFERLDRALRRRFDADIPSELVRSAWSYDLALRIEGKLAGRRSNARREVARWRTRRFDAAFAKTVRRLRPTAVLGFSDVGSEFTLPVCRRLGIPYVLSMVHGDVREEVDVLRREAETSPEFFPMYLGDGALDLD